MLTKRELKPEELGLTAEELRSIFVKNKIGGFIQENGKTTFLATSFTEQRLMEILS